MTNEFKRMQKLAGLIIESVIDNDDIQNIIYDVFTYFNGMDSSDSNEREKYIRDTYHELSPEEVRLVHMEVGKMLRNEFGYNGVDIDEGKGAYEYEKGKKAGEKIEKEKMSKTKLRNKIREMVLAEIDGAAIEAEDYDPVAEAKKKDKKDKEEDINIEDIEDIEDTNIDEPEIKEIPSTENDEDKNDPEIEHILDLLNQLQDSAEKLKDDKLLHQIGNTITFFTRQHVAEPDTNLNA